MARGRFREPAIVEPEPYYEPREPQGVLAPFIFGLIIGLGGIAVWLGVPQFPDALSGLYSQYIVANVPEDYRQYSIYGVVIVALLLLLFLRGILLRLPLIVGAVLGAMVWVPFGNHMMALAPQIEENLPELRAGIDGKLTAYPVLQNLREVAETNVAIPGTVIEEETAQEGG